MTPRFFQLEIFINIVSYNMAKIESFHQEKLGMTKYDKITALFMNAMNRQQSRKWNLINEPSYMGTHSGESLEQIQKD